MMCVDKIVNTSLEYSKLKSDCVNPYKGFACRQCANCMSRHTKKWVARLMHQATLSPFVLSFCLTYTEQMLNDVHLGRLKVEASRWAEDVIYRYLDGTKVKVFGSKHPTYYGSEYADIPTLSKGDVQRFVKRLRNYLKDLKFKYYAKGEYGALNHHPHIHFLLFPDLDCSYTEQQIREAVCRSWYNGILKFDYEDEPNKGRAWNRDKVVKVNPIVSFGEFNEDCAKYCSKYVSKESLVDCLPSHLVPEFILCSKGMSVDFYEPQIQRKRSLFRSLANEWETLDFQDFINKFDRVMTFVSNEGKNVFFPEFIRNRFFKGYYEYESLREGDVKGLTQTFKTWHPAQGAKTLDYVDTTTGYIFKDFEGRRMRDAYSAMVQHYCNIKRSQYFGLPLDLIFVDYDIVAESMKKIEQKVEYDEQSNKNRVVGAYRAHQRKVKQNSY